MSERKADADIKAAGERDGRPWQLGVMVLAVVAALIGLNGASVIDGCSQLRGLRPGKIAPDFALKSLDDKQVIKLSALRGKVVVLDFWAPWCKPCIRKFPELEKLQADFGDRGVRVLAINVGGQQARARQFIAKRQASKISNEDRLASTKVHKIIGLLDNRLTSAAYGVSTIPHVVVVGPDGRIVYVHIGPGGMSGLRRNVKQLLPAAKK
jgi:cytochrome c biogenesis protein CcmG/thiol:disulfide interchange protein DsbE